MSSGGSYDPHAIEGEIYRFWEEGGHFHAQPNPGKRPYVIDIPLPNVTGALHLGHALNNTMQDLLIRHKRMYGFEALWMPGTDHAGIATQAVVERRMKEEEGKTRHDIGRDALVKRIWDWKDKYGEQILMQLRRMGFSCDWARTRFTLDEVCAKAVYEVFFQWFKAGLIYRGTRLVNWDAHLQTAVADDEVIYETVKGHFWHYRYPILPGGAGVSPAEQGIEGSRDQGIKETLARAVAPEAKYGVDYLSIATTRPETMLGDTAICVHPDDPRYKHLVGRKCLLPLMNRPIPIIADAELAKMEMGTGCVKVTPGHDPKDYACGLRHNLPMINILTPDGKINENGRAKGSREQGSRDQGSEGSRDQAGGVGVSPAKTYDYVGLDRYEARKRVVADLEALGLIEKIEPYETEVGHSDRSKTPIEPMLSEQWFMKMGDLAESAMDAVRDGRVRFFPERYAKTYLDWLGEKRDWCISRQLWWGHRIPVWRIMWSADEATRMGEKRTPLEFVDTLKEWKRVGRIGVSPRDAKILEAERSGTLPNSICVRSPGDSEVIDSLTKYGWQQDPDVLDTWFSSALWPFSTLGWPHGPSRDREGAVESEPSGALQPLPHGRGSDQVLPSLADFQYFYPTSTLVTGRGIITLWVARMVMTGLYFTGRVPFQHVHIHPIIQDGQGRTMSKSLGNGVDPVDIIALYGTDALRFTMAQMDTETQDVRMPVKPVKMPDGRTVNSSEKFELGRNFCNKIWQAATGFVLSNLGEEGNEATTQPGNEVTPPGGSVRPPSLTGSQATARPLTGKDLALEDHWILSRLSATIAEVDRRLEAYQISEVANTLREFFWSDFCDWYVELVKPRLFGRDAAGEMTRSTDDSARVARQVLAWMLDQSLRLLHPIMPFITEALWQKLNVAAPRRGINKLVEGDPALIRAAWPDAAAWPRSAEIEAELTALQDVIRGLRDTLAWINTTRAASKTPAIGKLPQALIRAPEALAAGLREQASVITRLGRCEALEIGPDVAKPAECATKVFGGVELFVPIAGLADLAVERERLTKERAQLVEHIGRIDSKLANEGFVAKAPPAVVEKERARAAELREQLAALEGHLAEIATS